MRKFLMAGFGLLFATAALAAPLWTAPGWYQVAETIYGPVLWKGPFADEDSCKQTLPPNEEDADYACEYLSERPDWDD